MAVLVTGAKGMLGQDLCPIFEDAGYEVIETDVDTLDITNAEQVKQVLEECKPEIVIHCAAYTNVDKAEEDLKTAELINVTGTEILQMRAESLELLWYIFQRITYLTAVIQSLINQMICRTLLIIMVRPNTKAKKQ